MIGPRSITLRLAAALTLLLCSTLSPAAQLQVPEGWKVTPAGDDQWLVRPPEADAHFQVLIGPQQAIDTLADAWFRQRTTAELAKAGAQQSQAPSQNPDNGLFTSAGLRQNRQGEQEIIFLGGIATRDQRFARLATVTAGQSPQLKQYMHDAGAMLGHLATVMYNADPTTGKPTTGHSGSPGGSSDTAAAMPSAMAASASHDAMDPSQIEAVMYEGRGVYGAGGYQYREQVLLLLKDGSVLTDLEVPPSDLDLAGSRRQNADDWSHWRRQGSDYQIQNSKGEWKTRKLLEVRPLPTGAALDQSLVARSAHSSGGLGGSVFTRTIAFSRDGRFDRSASSLHGTGTVQSSAGFSGGASSYEDQNGRQSSSMSSGSSGGGTVGVSSRSREAASGKFSGTYRVSGYALELHTDAGTVERKLAFYPFDDNDTVYIGGTSYSKPK